VAPHTLCLLFLTMVWMGHLGWFDLVVHLTRASAAARHG
jgi:hypothetical protein